jgi:serine/threonine protein kinase
VLKCTLDYCAPEVLREQVWIAGDVWSMGVMALDLCKGLRRGSLVKYDLDGWWPTGKKWNWKNEQYLIAREQIRRSISDQDEGILTFIERLGVSSISIGQAALLSMTLQVLPGERDNLGLCDLIRPINMLRWPYPIGPLLPLQLRAIPVEDGTQRTMGINCTLHLTLDGKTYADSSQIPEPQGLFNAVSARRAVQLQYISLVLRALDKSTPKLFILTLDVLDRVSSPANLLELAKETPPSHFMLENACIIVASMVSLSHSLTSDLVLGQWKCLVTPTSDSYSVSYLQALVLRVLSTMQFRVVREDNMWELCGHNTKSEAYLKHMLESYLTWPNGTTDAYQHSDSLVCFLNTCVATNLPSWHPRIRFKSENNVLSEQWHHPKFESTLLSLGHASPAPTSTTSSPISASCSQLLAYMGDFRHPFLIPFNPHILSGVSRKDFEHCISAYVSAATLDVTQQQKELDACIVCTKDSDRICTQCESWSLCTACFRDFSGCCPQCLRTPELAQEWFIRSGATKKGF